MATLYVTRQGARIEKEYRRFLVTKDDEVLLAVPAIRVSEIVLVGRVGVTTPALQAMLGEGVGLTLLSHTGQLLGRLQPPAPKNIPRRHLQYRLAQDAEFCLRVSKGFVSGKLRNYRTLAHRLCRGQADVDGWLIDRLSAAIKQIDGASTLAALRGIEGAGTRAYFAILREGLQHSLGFERRARRPPTDPVNSLLSLGYTLLTQNLMAAAEIVGLDPYDGFFHADKHGRPSLALDLVEEFRGVVVDSVVRNVINREILTAEDFRPGPRGACYLTDRGLRIFFRQYNRRLQTEVTHPFYKRRLSYQKCFEVQARLLIKVMEEKLDAYPPFRVR